MKRLVNLMLGGALVFGLMASCSEEKKGYTIEGQIADVNEGMMYLKKAVGKEFVNVDSAVIAGGKFKFDGVAEEALAHGLTTR